MNKVISIHLNGRSYQLEESGYEALHAYLSEAETSLADNPDKAEILSDLEQALGEKCAKFISPHKDVVTASEITDIIAQMGPVGPAKPDAEQDTLKTKPARPKRLYLIREGAVLAGVCMGLAAYLDIDVTVVRIVFVVLTVLTGGAWIAAYVAMALLIPYANTGEEMAAARGETYKAQDIVDRAKDRFQESYQRFAGGAWWGKWDTAHRDHKQWKQELREKKRQWKYEMRMQRHPSPFLGFLSGFLGLLWVFALISLITTGAVFGWVLPLGVPLWVAIILLFVVYHAVTGPLKASRYQYSSGANGYHYSYSGWSGLEDSLGIIFLLIAGWFFYTHYPAVHDFVNGLPEQIRQWFDSIRNG